MAERRCVFSELSPQVPDPLLRLIKEFRDDPRADKIDLGVGVYRDEAGRTPILHAVKQAEQLLVERQESKAYLGPEGNPGFAAALTELVFGACDALTRCVQTPGGTGALRLAMDLIARANPRARVWVGTPTWPNHLALLKAAKLEARLFRIFDPQEQTICFDEMIEGLGSAQEGDVVLLHGCCHNPSGADLSSAQIETIGALLAERGLLPLIDLAYQGMGDGFDADGRASLALLERCGAGLLAYSCDKNFALYRERVGALFVRARNSVTAETVFSNMLSVARANWSMPPDHGGAIVGTILTDPALRADWQRELITMATRIGLLRRALAAAAPELSFLAKQKGFFSLLPLSPDQVAEMKARHGIYMAGSGRINVAGFREDNIPRFVDAYFDVTHK